MDNRLLKLEEVSLSFGPIILLPSVSFSLDKGQHMVIEGPSGSGKTLLAKIIAGIYPPTAGDIICTFQKSEVAYVAPQPWVDTQPDRTYFESRYEVFYGGNEVVDIAHSAHENTLVDDQKFRDFLQKMGMSYLLEKQARQLSNGESKTLQLASVFSQKSIKCYLLDKPFLGLDEAKRRNLTDYIHALSVEKTFISIGDNLFRDHVDHKIIRLPKEKQDLHHFDKNLLHREIVRRYASISHDYDVIVGMENVDVYYDELCILNGINWKVLQGEKWLVKGTNGSGKSMLMSLITADNPKAYNQNIVLFDHARGSGESIWDIKAKIGYVSPEAHMYFLKKENVHLKKILQFSDTLNDRFSSKISCGEVVESGLYERMDYSGGYISKNTRDFMACFGMDHLMNERYAYLSMGIQRILLLMRAMIKNPALLIFDEPCQGLDDEQKNLFLEAVSLICAQENSTVIYISHHLDEIPDNINKQLLLENKRAYIV
ncbi:MAG: ATP-binding cassette domain-containing protein [Saprospiraceae bacterium]|nr:ATP-binding cassette domain-containing protein [Saprospiraceae bacterium]